MNKVYFSKYCPIGGTIVVGDVVIEKLIDGKHELFQIDNENDIDTSCQTKAALHLCSTATIDDFINKAKIHHFYYPKDEMEEKPFVIVGLISNEVHWLRENTILNSDDLQAEAWWKGSKNDFTNYFLDNIDDEVNEPYIKVITVKCPCCNTLK